MIEDERSRVVAIARIRQPPGRRTRQSDSTLDVESGALGPGLAERGLRVEGITVGRSHTCRATGNRP